MLDRPVGVMKCSLPFFPPIVSHNLRCSYRIYLGKLKAMSARPPARRMLHTMLRVGNLQRSIDFYTKAMGMKHLRSCDFPEDKFTLAFLGYSSEREGTVIELTYNYGTEKYDIGAGYGHIAIGVENVKEECKRLEAEHQVTINYLSDDGFMAFIQDPDGYEIELLDEGRLLSQAEGTEAQKAS